jgi:uncharacterized protein involved in type VI secretion and phage assembly
MTGMGRHDGPRFFGKFRGTVTDNKDPLLTGRVRARVPDVLGTEESGWAMACTPFAGPGSGMFAVPAVGAGVWIEFEHGDPDFPIWSGGWWGGPLDPPTEAKAPVPFQQKIILKTEGGSSLILDDTPGTGGIFIKTSSGQKISITQLGIEIDNGSGGKISMKANLVSVNDGGLDVL